MVSLSLSFSVAPDCQGTVVQSHLPPFRNLGNFVHPTFACVFRTPKAGGPFYLVSMPGEVKDPTPGVNVSPVLESQILVGL